MADVVLVTGVSRYLGGRFARRLTAERGVKRVIGIDVIPPPHNIGSADFIRADIRNPMIARIISQAEVDTVVHMNGSWPRPVGAGGLRSSRRRSTSSARCSCSPPARRHQASAASWSSHRPPSMARHRVTPPCSPRTCARALPPAGFAKDSVEVEGYVRGFSRAAGRRRRLAPSAWLSSWGRPEDRSDPLPVPARGADGDGGSTPGSSSCTEARRPYGAAPLVTAGPAWSEPSTSLRRTSSPGPAGRSPGRAGHRPGAAVRLRVARSVRQAGRAGRLLVRAGAVPRLWQGNGHHQDALGASSGAGVHHPRGFRGLRSSCQAGAAQQRGDPCGHRRAGGVGDPGADRLNCLLKCLRKDQLMADPKIVPIDGGSGARNAARRGPVVDPLATGAARASGERAKRRRTPLIMDPSGDQMPPPPASHHRRLRPNHRTSPPAGSEDGSLCPGRGAGNPANLGSRAPAAAKGQAVGVGGAGWQVRRVRRVGRSGSDTAGAPAATSERVATIRSIRSPAPSAGARAGVGPEDLVRFAVATLRRAAAASGLSGDDIEHQVAATLAFVSRRLRGLRRRRLRLRPGLHRERLSPAAATAVQVVVPGRGSRHREHPQRRRRAHRGQPLGHHRAGLADDPGRGSRRAPGPSSPAHARGRPGLQDADRRRGRAQERLHAGRQP